MHNLKSRILGIIKEIVNKCRNLNRSQFIFIALLTFFAAIGITAAVMLLQIFSEYRTAQNEYKELRIYTPLVKPPQESEAEPEDVPPEEKKSTLLEMNPDYIGWMLIDGTSVDYPVVRGEDNERYLHTTFTGEENASGSIFMDFRCEEAFNAHFTAVYGHNMKDGSMFASLHSYRNRDFLSEYPNITVYTLDKEFLTYQVFSAQVMDEWDEVFSLFGKKREDVDAFFAEYGRPEGAEHFLILSTCTSGGNDLERYVVFAAR